MTARCQQLLWNLILKLMLKLMLKDVKLNILGYIVANCSFGDGVGGSGVGGGSALWPLYTPDSDQVPTIHLTLPKHHAMILVVEVVVVETVVVAKQKHRKDIVV